LQLAGQQFPGRLLAAVQGYRRHIKPVGVEDPVLQRHVHRGVVGNRQHAQIDLRQPSPAGAWLPRLAAGRGPGAAGEDHGHRGGGGGAHDREPASMPESHMISPCPRGEYHVENFYLAQYHTLCRPRVGKARIPRFANVGIRPYRYWSYS